GLLFDSSSKNASNDEPQLSSDAGKKDDEGVNKESGFDYQERPKNSTHDINTAGPNINTANTNVNTGSLNINTVSPTVTTAPLEATHADFFGDETKVDISNITTIYSVPYTLNIRIHKDHSLDHVIGDVQSGDVIENRNSFKPVPTTNADDTSATLIQGPVTTEEKVQKMNDVKARSMLPMALPNEHLMTFNQYKDAQTLFAAIQTRFGGNKATKKTQKTLLKQMYENFSAPST
ncbi:hypothetical protein Tco_0112840, partial [Tanacetum coccineum]